MAPGPQGRDMVQAVVPLPEQLSPKPGLVCGSGHMRFQPRRAPVLLKDRHPPRASPTPHTPPPVLRPPHLPALLEGTAQFKPCQKPSTLLVGHCHQNVASPPSDLGQPATEQVKGELMERGLLVPKHTQARAPSCFLPLALQLAPQAIISPGWERKTCRYKRSEHIRKQVETQLPSAPRQGVCVYLVPHAPMPPNTAQSVSPRGSFAL